MSDTNALSLRLLGAFEANVKGFPLHGLQERNGEKLLAYLALCQGRALSGVRVASLFWPDTGSLDSLRQSVSHLRRVLGDEAWRLDATRGSVRLDLTDADVDVVTFDTAVSQGEIPALRQAVSLYNGALLEGWTDSWVEKEREARREKYLESLRTIALHAMETGDYAKAAHWLRLFLRLKPAEEGCWRELMTALVRGGERLAAMDVYTRYRDFLSRKYNLPPPQAMTALYYEIQEQGSISLSPGQYGQGVGMRREVESIGGAVPLNSPFYIARPVDARLHAAIAQQESIVLLKGPRQTGKSSLLARGAQQARKRGSGVLITNFETFCPADMASLEQFLFRLTTTLANELDISFSAEADWNSLLGPQINLERFLLKRVMKESAAPLLWAMDEVDHLFPYSFSGDFFSMLRSWHEKRSFEPTKPWRRLTIAIACATEAHLYIKDLNKSPFNVGVRLTLSDFTGPQIAELNKAHGSPLRSESEQERFLQLLGGHPYLIRRGLQEMEMEGLNIEALEQRSLENEGPFGDHLRRLWRLVSADPELRQAVTLVLQNRSCDEESFFRLRSAGVLKGDSHQSAHLRCRLYGNFLKRLLI